MWPRWERMASTAYYVYKARCKINKLLMCRSWNQRFSTQDHFLLKAFLADTCAWLQWSFPNQFWERRFPYFRSLIFCLTASIFLPELSRTFYYSWEGITLPSSWLFARWFSSCSLDCAVEPRGALFVDTLCFSQKLLYLDCSLCCYDHLKMRKKFCFCPHNHDQLCTFCMYK